MSVIKAIILAPFYLIGVLISAIVNAVTSVLWLGVLLFIILAVLGLVRSVL